MDEKDVSVLLQPKEIPDYELILLIDEGGFGQIWMGRDVLGLHRAIKIIRHENSSSLESYQAEYHGLQHYAPFSRKYEGLIEIHHVGIREQDGFYYYVMDLADDLHLGDQVAPNYQPKTMRSYLDSHEGRRIPVREAIQIGIEAAESLSHLHSENLVHRDVKPENFLCINGKWKLADLGFVSTRGGKTYVGSLGYIAPEGPGNPSADVHGLGKILYEMVTGNEVANFPECPSWVFDVSDEADLFKAMNTVVLKAADPIAQNRQQSGLELLADLNSILPREQTDITVIQGNQGWGRYVYALLALLLVLFVMIYIRMIDQALAETTDAPIGQSIKAVEID
ncbi:MAG: serine/threonine-protein kinase [Verrucomicrobiota bacterium]|nr:serine/threonine-protein kinase [Verrucomicrobiota bacterium]